MVQPDLGPLEGRHLRFRLVTPEDAAYIQQLRTSPDYGRFLSPPAPSVEAQRAWIEAYKHREAEGREFYFVIERLDDGRPCGTMRVYGILPSEATWGSFILDENKPPKAALDALLLVHSVIFDRLGLDRALFDVRKDNARALALYLRFGGTQIGNDAIDLFFRIDSADFARRAPSLRLAIEGNSR
jgi:RimJ/RimL family protein N-acetyltransferase